MVCNLGHPQQRLRRWKPQGIVVIPRKEIFGIFNRGPFTSPPRLLPEKNSTGNYRRTTDGNYVYSKQLTHLTVPNLEYLFQKGISFNSHPADWFNLFPPFKRDKYTHEKSVTMDDLTVWTNVECWIFRNITEKPLFLIVILAYHE